MTTQLILQRTEQSDKGTFGTIYEDGKPIAVTCERPHNGNQKMGCIPADTYHATQFNSPHNGQCFLLANVPGRSMIEMHKGNTIDDTEGCILVGASMGEVNNKHAVIGSRAKLEQLLDRYPDGFNLVIVDDFEDGKHSPDNE